MARDNGIPKGVGGRVDGLKRRAGRDGMVHLALANTSSS